MNGNDRIRVKVSGDYACWTRPENKVERVSYECMTPSAARNILDAICWRPEMRWVVTKIGVLKPVKYQALRRNEVQSKVSVADIRKGMQNPGEFRPMVAGAGSDEVTQRNTLALRDVAYVIEAHALVFEPSSENTSAKYVAMFQRRVEKGQCYHRPALGCREFACEFEPVGKQDLPLLTLDIDMGMMLYDIIFRRDGNQAVFFRARLQKGELDAHPERAIPDPALRKEMLSCSYKR